MKGRSYLSVEKAVKEGGEEALKGDEERRDEAPGGEVGQVFVVRRCHHLEAVGDPEQRLQHDGSLHRFPARKESGLAKILLMISPVPVGYSRVKISFCF